MDSKEQNLIIKTLLNKLSLTTQRTSMVNIKLRKFGAFHTHGNRKRMSKLKYLRKWNKKNWRETQRIKEDSIEYLLFSIILCNLFTIFAV